MKTVKACLTAGALIVALIPVAPAVQEDSARDSVARHMHAHLSRVTTVREAIIGGDLEGARTAARWLAEHDAVAGLPDGWQSHLDALRASARRVAGANNFVAAAHGAASMARQCGRCHAEHQVTIELPRAAPPSDDDNARVAHMLRHQWSAERLWQALYAPSGRAWDEGVDLLLEAPLTPAESGHPRDDETAELRFMARQVHLIGSRGISVEPAEQRSQLYGEYLSLCAECHTSVRRGQDRQD